ncbi:hypothetical protein SVIO_067640 [Streptomyces violaceusniger]|uniref:Uncharacterized protein n=1 Tax=Streptomyces violaceusniger TaxID=68280 RepID=A0A4D4L3E5_STRVO|nr:hypothetical protein SVIO_067640 [Streptomyces violaceusniger]
MDITVVNGLPAHVLIVHFVVVFVPLSALAVVVGAIWPSAARRMGVVLPLLALVTLASVPVATGAGEWLEEHVDSDVLVRRHAELGDGLLPWAVGLFVMATAVWWTTRRPTTVEAAPGSGPGQSPPGPRRLSASRQWCSPSWWPRAPSWTCTGSATPERRPPGTTASPGPPVAADMVTTTTDTLEPVASS